MVWANGISLCRFWRFPASGFYASLVPALQEQHDNPSQGAICGDATQSKNTLQIPRLPFSPNLTTMVLL
jgi:hypothetical protein